MRRSILAREEEELNSKIEREITKQIQEFDRRVDRTGWPILIIGIIVLFLLIYLLTNLFSIPTNKQNGGSHHAVDERIERLENRVSSLEDQLKTSE